jgi:hypothetical protein
MELIRLIVSILFFALGLLYIISPATGFQIRTYLARKVFGVKIIPGKRTYLAYRIMGVAFILIAFFMNRSG